MTHAVRVLAALSLACLLALACSPQRTTPVVVAPSEPADAASLAADAGTGADDDPAPLAVLPSSFDEDDGGANIGVVPVVPAGALNVLLAVNLVAVRAHPLGAKLAATIAEHPMIRDGLLGSTDPVTDLDWLALWGPSLIHTGDDLVVVRTSADVAVVHTGSRSPKLVPYDAGVPGMRAYTAYADNAARVVLRPQPNLIVIAPPRAATAAAQAFKKQAPSLRLRPHEVLRLVANHPAQMVSVPPFHLSNELETLRVSVVAREDGGADFGVDGTCADEACAQSTVTTLEGALHRADAAAPPGVRGKLGGVHAVAAGTRVKMRWALSRPQLEALLQGASAR